MCCLNYEQNVYEQLNKTTPKVGAVVSTPEGEGTVISASILEQKVKVRLDAKDTVETYACDDVRVVRSKRKRDDAVNAESLKDEKTDG